MLCALVLSDERGRIDSNICAEFHLNLLKTGTVMHFDLTLGTSSTLDLASCSPSTEVNLHGLDPIITLKPPYSVAYISFTLHLLQVYPFLYRHKESYILIYL
jgi:hypothetical protein